MLRGDAGLHAGKEHPREAARGENSLMMFQMPTRERAWFFAIVLIGSAICLVAALFTTSQPFSSTTRYAIVLMLLIGMTYTFAGYFMVDEIRTIHPDLYDEIARPTQNIVRSVKQEWRFFIFLLSRKYASIDSRKIRLLGDIVWLCSIANWFLLLYLLLFHFHEFDARS
jgi:hypothetical protein